MRGLDLAYGRPSSRKATLREKSSGTMEGKFDNCVLYMYSVCILLRGPRMRKVHIGLRA